MNYIDMIRKSIVFLVSAFIFYIIMLIVSAYAVSISSNNVIKNITNDFNRLNNATELETNIFSVDTKESIKESNNINIKDNIKFVLNNKPYKKAYLVFSTGLFIIMLIIYNLNKSENVDKRVESIKEESDWFSYNEFKTSKKNNIISEKNGLILGKAYLGKKDRIITVPSKCMINKHNVVIGTSGTGKSENYVKTNLLNLSEDYQSFIISDPKGEYYRDTSKYLISKGYNVRIINLNDASSSDRWNILENVEDEKDAKQLAILLVSKALKDETVIFSFDNIDMEVELIKNLIIYVMNNFSKSKKNIVTIHNILEMISYKELDFLFKETKITRKMKAEFSQYLALDNTSKERVYRNVEKILRIFGDKKIKRIFKGNEINFKNLKVRPCAYYLVLPEYHNELDIVGTTFIMSMIKELLEADYKEYSDEVKNRELYLFLDDFKNFGYIPKFLDMMPKLRSRNINCSIIIQTILDLKTVYDEQWQQFIDYSDILMYFGGNHLGTKRYISQVLSKGASSDEYIKKYMNKVGALDVNNCLAILRGQTFILLDKISWKMTKQYDYIVDDDSNNINNFMYKIKEKFGSKDSYVSETIVNKNIKDYEEGIEEDILGVLESSKLEDKNSIKIFNIKS